MSKLPIGSFQGLNSFNALRLLLALIVLVGHSGVTSGNEFNFQLGKIPLTFLSVYCFFILSGYLITPGLVSSGGFNYVVRRIARIYPAYIGVILVVGFGLSSLWQKINPVKSFSLFNQIQYFGFNILPPPGLLNQESKMVNFLVGQPISVPLSGVTNGSLWSLTLEFMAYLALLILFILSKKVGKTLKLILFWILLIAYIWSIIATIILDTYYLRNPTIFEAIILKWPYLFCFFSGALFSLIKNKKWNSNGIIFIIFTFFLFSTAKPFLFALFGVFCLTILVVYLGESKIFARLPLRVDISYGIYLYHFPVQQTLAQFIQIKQNLLLFTSLSIFFTSLLAYASAKLIEGPSQRKAKVWITKRQSRK
jgi:peptidoglycan/LPS O-acetylase OafA/YrhL